MSDRKVLFAATILMAILLPSAISFGQSLPEIRDSIRQRGQRWLADETSISVLPDHEKRRRLGLIKEDIAGNEQMLALQGPPPPGLPRG